MVKKFTREFTANHYLFFISFEKLYLMNHIGDST